jgi:hypothetical protein
MTEREEPIVPAVRLKSLDKAFELFSRTVRTSDPEVIVRYAAAFERYLRDGAGPTPDSGPAWQAAVERGARAWCAHQGLDPDAPRHDPDDSGQFTSTLWQQEAPLIEVALRAAIGEEPRDE